MPTAPQAHTFTRIHLLAYLSLCLIWGSTWLAIRVVVHDVPPFEAAALRFVAAGALLLGAALLQKRRWPRGRDQWTAVFVLSLTMMTLPYGLLFWAEQHVMSSMTAVLYSAMPLAVSLFTPAMMHRKVPRTAVFGMVIAFAALLSLFYRGELGGSPRSIVGGVLVLVSMALSSWSVVYAKLRLRDVDSVVATGLQLFFGSVALLWATWALEAHRHASCSTVDRVEYCSTLRPSRSASSDCAISVNGVATNLPSSIPRKKDATWPHGWRTMMTILLCGQALAISRTYPSKLTDLMTILA